MAYKKISDYGIIGNTKTAALVGKDGSVDWFCYPQFDSPSVFAALIDEQKGGKFQIVPVDRFRSEQRYIPRTNILETIFETSSGKAKIIDFMPVFKKGDSFYYDDGIYREIECLRGQVKLKLVLDPKPNYAKGGQLPSGLRFISDKFQRRNTAEISQGEKGFAAFSGPSAFDINILLEKTKDYWESLTKRIVYQGRFRDSLERSYLTLHLLTHTPSGSLIAAPTTSLPERIGGPRNWDYRFVWLRDAAFTLQAFFALQDLEEALTFFSCLTSLCASCGIDIKVAYTIDQKPLPHETILHHLEGYMGSKPVRVGNAAGEQLQLDIFGELVDALYIYHLNGGEIDLQIWSLVKRLVDAVCENWGNKDQGIWEVRSGPWHFVSSKVMAWVALDRGLMLAKKLGLPANRDKWKSAAREVRKEVLEKGWNGKVGSFTQHYETDALDASILLAPLVGFIDATHPKMRSTIKAVTSRLVENGFLHRYLPEKTPDGLLGSEGVFLAPNFWYVQNLILLGEIDEAVVLYEKLLKLANHLGLFAEMADPKTAEALGNFPQALTHLEIIITAFYLKEAGVY